MTLFISHLLADFLSFFLIQKVKTVNSLLKFLSTTLYYFESRVALFIRFQLESSTGFSIVGFGLGVATSCSITQLQFEFFSGVRYQNECSLKLQILESNFLNFSSIDPNFRLSLQTRNLHCFFQILVISSKLFENIVIY